MGKRHWLRVVSAGVFFSVCLTPAWGDESKCSQLSLSTLKTERVSLGLGQSVRYLIDNISAPGTARGSVIAATSRQEPDYFYHWVRDAGLVMDIVVTLYRGANGSDKERYRHLLQDYINFSRSNQTANTLSGLGEPKFYVDGTPFSGPWGRPQTDGPALRAIALIRFAETLLAEGQEGYVRERLYDGKIPTHSVIKSDLEYVSHHWKETAFDLWEEIRGMHFYTSMVQRRALVLGAKLADRLGDGAAAGWYRNQARLLEAELLRHWSSQQGIFVTTLDRDGGVDYKYSGLDASVILAILHGYNDDGFLAPSDDRLLSTFQKIRSSFHNLYPINQRGHGADAVGRYPEDRYDGGAPGGGGNPWILITVGFGEYLYRAAASFQAQGFIRLTDTNREFFRTLDPNIDWGNGTLQSSHPNFTRVISSLRQLGDDFLLRAQFHGYSDGRFSEQINRNTGFMQGAANLTWSYASWVSAVVYRNY